MLKCDKESEGVRHYDVLQAYVLMKILLVNNEIRVPVVPNN